MTVQRWSGDYHAEHILLLQRELSRVDAECHRLGKQNDELCDQLYALQMRLQAAEERIRVLEGMEP